MDYTSDLAMGVEGIRIGIVPGYFFYHLQPPVDQAAKTALKTFEELGASVVEVEIQNIHGNISAQLTIESAEPTTYHQKWLREEPQSYGEDVRTLLEMGELLFAPTIYMLKGIVRYYDKSLCGPLNLLIVSYARHCPLRPRELVK